MAKIFFKKKGEPSAKVNYTPESSKVRKKYRILLFISIIINILLTTQMVNKKPLEGELLWKQIKQMLQ